MPDKELAYLAGGCFWCTEAVFKRLKGVLWVKSGYMGGFTKNPNYEEVSKGTTNHTEVVEITFDPKIISYKTLLEVFWQIHDPTSLNQQGADKGTQYRSVLFFTNDNQKSDSENSRENAQLIFDKKIVTEIIKADTFYPAESYHKNYYENNKTVGYCKIVIDPKIQKLYKQFPTLTK